MLDCQEYVMLEQLLPQPPLLKSYVLVLQVKIIFKGADMFMVEAASKHERTLSQVGVPYTFAVLGDEEKMVEFYQVPVSFC